jgi:hypothetical protein
MGMPLDMKQRETLARVDDEDRRQKIDTARKIIYNKNYAVDTENVEILLQPQSLVPTSVSPQINIWHQSSGWCLFMQNAFSKRLSHLGFNLFPMFVVDLMHEFELGVWKALFIHLLRILHAANKDLIHELDRRYVDYPISFNSWLTCVGRFFWSAVFD